MQDLSSNRYYQHVTEFVMKVAAVVVYLHSRTYNAHVRVHKIKQCKQGPHRSNKKLSYRWEAAWRYFM